jgi:biotin carboxyl carrier protein
MPHDVIMPALGMAQDTGLIVSWLKKPGDAVKTGEGLMEVETDKAVMEVEAVADGFLAAVSAEAGDHVPVGQVVAVIAETAEAAKNTSPSPSSSTPQDDEPTSRAESETEPLPSGAEIIMPALGMAQDSGLIVAWRKKPGDPVAASDVLLEVETDKSVMEVEAGHDGFVAAILAGAEQAVPVGSVIAIISAAKPENAVARSHKSGPARDDEASGAVTAKAPPAAGKGREPEPYLFRAGAFWLHPRHAAWQGRRASISICWSRTTCRSPIMFQISVFWRLSYHPRKQLAQPPRAQLPVPFRCISAHALLQAAALNSSPGWLMAAVFISNLACYGCALLRRRFVRPRASETRQLSWRRERFAEQMAVLPMRTAHGCPNRSATRVTRFRPSFCAISPDLRLPRPPVLQAIRRF